MVGRTVTDVILPWAWCLTPVAVLAPTQGVLGWLAPMGWCVGIDNLNTSFEFVLRWMGRQRQLYQGPTIERYALYVVLTGLWWGCCLLAWTDRHLWWLLGLASLPPSVNFILSSRLAMVVKSSLRRSLARLAEHTILHLSVYLINLVCVTSLSYNPAMTPEELRRYSTTRNLGHVLDFIKLFAARICVLYLRYLNSTLSSIADQLFSIYAWKTHKCTFYDPLPQVPDPKEKLRILISNRAWNVFYNVYMIRLILTVDENQSQLVQKISKCHSLMALQFGKICAIYTLVSMSCGTSSVWTGPVCALLTLAFAKAPSLWSLRWMVVSFPVTYNLGWYLLLSECSTLAKIRPVSWCLTQGRQFIGRHARRIFVVNSFARQLIWSTLAVWLIPLVIRPFPVGLAVLMSVSPVPGVVILLGLIGWLSRYSVFHLVYVSILVYLAVRIGRTRKPIAYTHIQDYFVAGPALSQSIEFVSIPRFEENFYSV